MSNVKDMKDATDAVLLHILDDLGEKYLPGTQYTFSLVPNEHGIRMKMFRLSTGSTKFFPREDLFGIVSAYMYICYGR